MVRYRALRDERANDLKPVLSFLRVDYVGHPYQRSSGRIARLAATAENVAVVPHRHFTFTIPKMLRPYFRFHRGLLKQLCRIVRQCVSDFLRDASGDAGKLILSPIYSIVLIAPALHLTIYLPDS